VGQSEKSNNSGFSDPTFEQSMKDVGWRKGQAWCAYFVRLCVRLAGYVDYTSPGAVQTYRNYEKRKMTGSEAREGAIAVWQSYKDGKPVLRNGMYPGHVGIVERVSEDGKTMSTIEGNTDGEGSREGDGVRVKIRYAATRPIQNGLRLVGFCYPTPKATDPA
jgi:hypothetical protein